MNRRRLRFAAVTTTTIFSLLISLLTSTFPVTSAVNSTSDNLNLRRTSPLILPLSLSRKIPSAKLRRLLQAKRVPINARMNLFDDLLSNGYYTTRLYIGTPPQEFALIVDTGSTVTYVPCSDCDQCGNHQDPKFQPDLSTTYHPVKCNPDCTCDAENAQCVYERQYAEMSSSSGVLGEDIVSFGNQSELKPQRAVFGCENAETGDLYSQHADGIMGLGRGDLSIVDQLVDKSVIGDSFSLCYGGMGIGGGAMILGSLSPPSDMVFSHSDPDRSPYYNIELKELHVAGKKLAIDPKLISELHGLKQIRGPDPNYNDICFSGAGRKVSELSKTFPAVDMVFENGLKYLLSPENYLFKHSKVPGAYCLGVFQNGKDPTTLLGGEIKVGFITFDMSLSIKDSDLKPRISELSGFIAQELGVNTLQVHLLNFTSSGNGSLITWGIYPEKSAKYIANTTAMHIIAHLAEHNVQLPDTFGSYTLANWKVEPPMKRSWWHQHYLLVVMAVIVSLMLGISVYGIWFIRKWRQQTTIQYKPVDSDTVVPEQELQPL
uniref:Peptidase A1 domain-containing protein n=1 Tax=Chenopodium quinoa TaxID=63459 RepID=A0A803KY46_CHEQI